MNAQAQAWGRSSRERYEKNLEFAKGMKLHGEPVTVPCRGGDRPALFHKSAVPGLRPTVFELYGGGFSQGYVANDDNLRTRMCEATGYHVVGLDYRKSFEQPYPAGLEDVFDAVCYFSDHAEEYGIDKTRLAVWGHSAGANLACVLSLLSKETGRFSLRAQLLDHPFVDGATPGIEKTGPPPA